MRLLIVLEVTLFNNFVLIKIVNKKFHLFVINIHVYVINNIKIVKKDMFNM